MSEPRLQLSLFGGLRARVNGQPPRELSRQQSGALLAFLALNAGRPFAREELIDLFWEEDGFDEGRRRLRQAIYNVRRLLHDTALNPESLFVSSRDMIGLNDSAVCVDVHEFERELKSAASCKDPSERVTHLTRADALYRGDLLSGFYQEVFETERLRLQAMRRKMLCELSRAHESLGQIDGAISAAQRLVALDPLVEEAHVELMGLYSASGRPSEVLRQYRDLERVLAAELGECPTVATREVAERLRAEAELARPLDRAAPRGDNTVDLSPAAPVGRLAGQRPKARRLIPAFALCCLAAFLAWSMALSHPSLPRYTLFDLGTLGGKHGYVTCISNSGLIGGRTSSQDGPTLHGCIWIGTGGIRHLPGIGWVHSIDGVNDAGNVVGEVVDRSHVAHCVIWDGAKLYNIGANFGPTSMNAAGHVICYQYDSRKILRTFLWIPGKAKRDISNLGGHTHGIHLSDDDCIAGRATTPQGRLRAFMWTPGSGMRDIGTLGGDSAEAQGINGAREVVGFSQIHDNGATHAFIWDEHRGMRDIGPPGVSSAASRINSHHQVVGHFGIDEDERATIWTEKTGPVDLNSLIDHGGSGWVLNEAVDINDGGWIVGTGTLNGHREPFLLVPQGDRVELARKPKDPFPAGPHRPNT